MSGTVVVSGNPRAGSRTSALARAVGAALGGSAARALGGPAELALGGEVTVVEVGALGPGLLTPGDPATAEALVRIRDAELLVVATPTYKGSYTGILKALLDQLPANGLAGIHAVPVVTAGVESQARAAADLLSRLLGELGATVLAALPVVESGLAEQEALVSRHVSELELA